MRFSLIAALPLVAAVSAEADGIEKRGIISDLLNALLGGKTGQPAAKCPAVWYNVSAALTPLFVENGECNFRARASIRTAFHDCFSWSEKRPVGGCDGSIFLGGEFTRVENSGLNPAVPTMAGFARRFGVGIGDAIQFAAGSCNSPHWILTSF